MKLELAPFQEKGRDFLASKKTALLADQQRLGKSAQVIRAADKVGAKKILIVCPASVKITWLREFEKWAKVKRSIDIISGTDPKNISDKLDVTIINYDILWRHEIKMKLIKLKFGVIAIDECHYLAGRQSNRTIAMLDTTDRTPILSRGVYRWFTSGTPITSRPKEFYPILAACAPSVINPYLSYRAYTRYFCGGYWDQKWIDKGATHTKELNQRLKSFMLRRTRKDVLGEMPLAYQMIPIRAKGKEIITYVAKELTWGRDDASFQKMDDEDEIATVRRKLGVYKIPAALQHISYLLTVEDKLVVFGYHREVMKTLSEKVPNSVLVMGGMSGAAKQESIDKFKDDPNCKVFLGQITSAGVGIDLSSAKMILFVESSWVPGEIDQAADRCSGFNQKEEVAVQFMVIQDSLEEHMLRTVIEKKQNIEKIIETPSIFD